MRDGCAATCRVDVESEAVFESLKVKQDVLTALEAGRRSSFRRTWRSNNRPVAVLAAQKKPPSRRRLLVFRQLSLNCQGDTSPVLESMASPAGMEPEFLRLRLLDCFS